MDKFHAMFFLGFAALLAFVFVVVYSFNFAGAGVVEVVGVVDAVEFKGDRASLCIGGYGYFFDYRPSDVELLRGSVGEHVVLVFDVVSEGNAWRSGRLLSLEVV